MLRVIFENLGMSGAVQINSQAFFWLTHLLYEEKNYEGQIMNYQHSQSQWGNFINQTICNATQHIKLYSVSFYSFKTVHHDSIRLLTTCTNFHQEGLYI